MNPFKAFYKALMGQIPFERGSFGGSTVPYFGQSFELWDAFWTQRTQTIDYAKELGDLRTSALLMAAYTWLSGGLTAARLTVVELDKDNKETEIQNHPLAELWDQPNPYYGSDELLSGIALDWLIYATAYIIVVRNKAGMGISELWYEPCTTIRPVWPMDGSAFIGGYEIQRDGYWYSVPLDSVLVLRKSIDPVTRMGVSATSALLREYYTDRQAAEFTSLLMKQGLVPPLLVTLGNDKIAGTHENAVELQQQLKRKMSGGTAGEAAIIPGPADVHLLSYDYGKVGLRDVRQVPEERFCAAMGISPYSLHFGTSRTASTFSNVEQYLKYDYRAYIVPLQKYIAQRLTKELLPVMDSNGNHQVCWNYDDVPLMQTDVTADWNRIIAAFKSRVLDQAEARDGLGYAFDESHKGVYYPVPAATTSENEPEGTPAIPAAIPPLQLADGSAKAFIEEASLNDGRDWWRKRAPKEAQALIDATSSEAS